MARCAGTGATLIDLGAGNCAKAMRLFPVLEPSRYVAVDIAVDFLRHVRRSQATPQESALLREAIDACCHDAEQDVPVASARDTAGGAT